MKLEVFKDPPAKYRGVPFWSWNCRLDKSMIEMQAKCFKKMGFGGYIMHTRYGLATEYLSDEFMDSINFAIKCGEKNGMFSWLYDEDRWPSGYAGGLVTKNPRFRQRALYITKDSAIISKIEKNPQRAFEKGLPYLLGCYDVKLDFEGYLEKFKIIDVHDDAVYEKYYAYSKTNEPTDRHNFYTYADIMQPEAVREFIRITHECYFKKVGAYYGKNIPAIFSDEPRQRPIELLDECGKEIEAAYHWTFGFEKSFEAKYGYDLLSVLPYLVWDTKSRDFLYVRYDYFMHAAELFERAFFAQVKKVTEKHGIDFAGHLMLEGELYEQLKWSNDVMRMYPYFDIPGIDMLYDNLELITAKQAQSVVRQYGKKAMLSEMYGVTGWDFDFKCLKMQGDWQAALGVTVRVPHLAMMSMQGGAKRDYPASFNYQSPWYEDFDFLESHFARLAAALSEGMPIVRIAVLNPIETTMINTSTMQKTNNFMRKQQSGYENITKWLLYNTLDFDIISENALPELSEAANGEIRVGKMTYELVFIPPVETLRSTTVKVLEQYAKNGGRIVFFGDCPRFVDGRISEAANNLYRKSKKIRLCETDVLHEAEPVRDITVMKSNGERTDNIIYQLRKCSDGLWLFASRAEKMGKTSYKRRQTEPEKIIIEIKGMYYVELYDTIAGEITAADFNINDNKTTIKCDMYANDSILLKLSYDANVLNNKNTVGKNKICEIRFDNEVEYKLSEPNVAILDFGRYSIDGFAFSKKTYILDADAELADDSGIKRSQVQPYILQKNENNSTVYLQYEFESTIDVNDAWLAIERAEDSRIFLNSEQVDMNICGTYIDASIKKVKLPKIQAGKNTIRIETVISETKYIEPCYLLGDFGAELADGMFRIIPKREKIEFRPLSHVGMPFYGGDVIYKTEIETPDCTAKFHVTDFGAHCVRVYADGEDIGLIALAPFCIEKRLKKGRHIIEFLCRGNRNNTLGPIHNSRMNDPDYYIAPDAWNSRCEFFTNGYFLQNTGILSSPIIEIFEN